MMYGIYSTYLHWRIYIPPKVRQRRDTNATNMVSDQDTCKKLSQENIFHYFQWYTDPVFLAYVKRIVEETNFQILQAVVVQKGARHTLDNPMIYQ